MFEKVGRFMRPLASNFGCVDDSTVSSAQLGVRSRLESHLLCGCPSLFFGYTSMVFVAICAPLKRGRPSATTSSIRPPACTVSNAKSRRNTFVETLAPASHTPAAAHSSEYPRPPQNPNPRTRCAVVAGVKWTAQANARDQSENLKGIRRDSNRASSPGSNLGHTSPLQNLSSVVETGRCRPQATAHHPRTSNPRLSDIPLPRVVQSRNHFLCHVRVATLDGQQRIGPICPVSSESASVRAAKAQSSYTHRNSSGTWSTKVQ